MEIELKTAQRNGFVLKQEVVELREVSESFNERVAEIDDELSAKDAEISELKASDDNHQRQLADVLANYAAARGELVRTEEAVSANGRNEARALAAEAALAEAQSVLAQTQASLAAADEKEKRHAAEDAADLKLLIEAVEQKARDSSARAEAQQETIMALEARCAALKVEREAASAWTVGAGDALLAAATAQNASLLESARNLKADRDALRVALSEAETRTLSSEANVDATRSTISSDAAGTIVSLQLEHSETNETKAVASALRGEIATLEAARAASMAEADATAHLLRGNIKTLEFERDEAITQAKVAADELRSRLRILETEAEGAQAELAAARCIRAEYDLERQDLLRAVALNKAGTAKANFDAEAAMYDAERFGESATEATHAECAKAKIALTSVKAELDVMRNELKSKDARIKRLEQVKMTTEIFKKIQQMQVEKARAEGEVVELRSQLQCLDGQLSTARSASRSEAAASVAVSASRNHADSPPGDVAVALAGDAAAPASVAARLQLDELAERNAELAAEIKTVRKALDTERAAGLDVTRRLASLVGESSLPTLEAAAEAVTKLATESRNGLKRAENEKGALLKKQAVLEDKASELAQRAENAEKGVKALQTPAGRRAAQNAAAFQEKIEFLEKENLDLMLEIKSVQQLALKHKADADAFRSQHDFGGVSPAPPSATKRSASSEPRLGPGKIRLDVDKENLLAASNGAILTSKKQPFATCDDTTTEPVVTGEEQPPECSQS
jgi:hypothetical protein